MITDVFTKNSHYRVDDDAQTVECIGPDAFGPHKVLATGVYSPPTVGRRFVAVWATVGPTGKGVMHTSTVVRVERSEADAGRESDKSL